MSEAEQERAAIVAWFYARADLLQQTLDCRKPAIPSAVEYTQSHIEGLRWNAHAIENGAHLAKRGEDA